MIVRAVRNVGIVVVNHRWRANRIPSDASPTIPSEETTPKPIPNPSCSARKSPARSTAWIRDDRLTVDEQGSYEGHRNVRIGWFNDDVLPELLPFPVHCCSGGAFVSC